MDRTTATKRKAPIPTLQRRVRARRDEPEPDSDEVFSEESDEEENTENDEPEAESEGEEDDEEDSASESEEEDDDDDDDAEEEAEDPSAAASQISFGALAKAQASLPAMRRGKGRTAQGEDEDDDSDSNSDQPETQPTDRPRLPKPHRSNKHAPTEQTSKRPVTRRREVVEVRKREARDPRFSAAVSGGPLEDDYKARKAYGFLDEYRDAEMARLRDTIRKTREPRAKEELKRALASMESRKRQQQQRDRERQLLDDHRKQEKELVAQGKQPFYLKKSEQKKRLLVDRFAGMKKKQVDRTIERRRKKMASRERKNMPMPRARRDATGLFVE
ncbi:DUF947-domain-containing protein [Hypoxylon fuscum]|nr:DUF947-domain-containing protein [Hypoxylon fuscum]